MEKQFFTKAQKDYIRNNFRVGSGFLIAKTDESSVGFSPIYIERESGNVFNPQNGKLFELPLHDNAEPESEKINLGDIDFLLEYGIEPDTFDLLTEAAQSLVNNAEPENAYIVFFNQIVNQCKRNNIDSNSFFIKMVEHLQRRINSPKTPEDYLRLFPDDEGF